MPDTRSPAASLSPDTEAAPGLSTRVLIPVKFAIPYVPHIDVLGFVRVPPSLLAVLAGITALYVLATELMKKWFYRKDVGVICPLGPLPGHGNRKEA